jgi:Mg-chelatase subunit ChlD
MSFQPPTNLKPLSMRERMEAEKAARATALATTKTVASTNALERTDGFVDPMHEAVKDRIKIIFDDSGSMSGEKFKNAQAGCIEFMKNCAANKSAVGIYPLDCPPIPMDTNLPVQAALVPHIKIGGSTPLFETLDKAQQETLKATRYIIFSDGEPDNVDLKDSCIKRAKEEKTPIDTVYIGGAGHTHAIRLLREIAESTGGISLIFDPTKVNFREAFKYLTPGLRGMLTSGSFAQNLQEGRLK